MLRPIAPVRSAPRSRRAAVVRAVEVELDRVDAAGAERKGGAADDDADQHAGDEAEVNDERGNGDQRQIFEQQQVAATNERAIDRPDGTEIEQQPAESVFRHIAEERTDRRPAHRAEIAATVSPDSRLVAPAVRTRIERLSDVQTTMPPSAAGQQIGKPCTLRSRSILASRRVAISIPVVLSSSC